MLSEIPPPVQIRFDSLYWPDTSVLAETLLPFGRWSEQSIARSLPIVVSYPTKIAERLKVLEGYLAAGGWPPQVHPDAIQTIRAIIEQMMPQVEAEIARGVRLMAAASIRDDGSRAVAHRDQILQMFLASKMLATARALNAYQLVDEAQLDWGAEFYEMASEYSDQLIYGLSLLARRPHGWAGWTDADLFVDQDRYRIIAPICPAPEEMIRVDTLSPEEVRRLIVPQLLRSGLKEGASILAIRRLIFEPWESFADNLVLRDEVFVDSETCSNHRNAKAYIIRIAADRIASRLQQVPPKERPRQLWEMTHSLDSVSFDVARRVREVVPFE